MSLSLRGSQNFNMSKLKICLTHDVDRTRKTFQYITHDLRKLRFGKLRTLVNGTRPYWQFEHIMEIEESFGVRSTFFFLHESLPFEPFNPSNWKLSLGRYSLDKPDIKRIIRKFDAGGWEIGLHGSYNSYKNIKLLIDEKSILEDVLGKKVTGIRQHYLNLNIPETWILQREAGFEYDASYGKKRGIGYLNNRYRPFADESSGMYIIPLALMECYLFSEAKNDPERAWSITKSLMDEAEQNDAVFTVLWHQRMFNEEEFTGYAEVYRRIIAEGKQREANFVLCRDLYHEYLPEVRTFA